MNRDTMPEAEFQDRLSERPEIASKDREAAKRALQGWAKHNIAITEENILRYFILAGAARGYAALEGDGRSTNMGDPQVVAGHEEFGAPPFLHTSHSRVCELPGGGSQLLADATCGFRLCSHVAH